MGSKYFFIVSGLNGMVLDLAEHSHEPGSKVVTWPRKDENSDNQLWFEDPMTRTIRSKEAPDLCLEVPDDENTLVVNPFEEGKSSQRWTVHGDCVHNVDDDNRVLDVAKECCDEGARVCAWSSHGGDNQKFTCDYTPKIYFFIKSKMHGKVIDIEACNPDPGTNVLMWAQKDEDNDNQLWYEDRHGYIRSKLNDLILDSSDGLKMEEYSHGKTSQHWCFHDDRLENASDKGNAIDICGANQDDGASLLSYGWHGGPNQLWERVYV